MAHPKPITEQKRRMRGLVPIAISKIERTLKDDSHPEQLRTALWAYEQTHGKATQHHSNDTDGPLVALLQAFAARALGDGFSIVESDAQALPDGTIEGEVVTDTGETGDSDAGAAD